jgi:hypothetical protein
MRPGVILILFVWPALAFAQPTLRVSRMPDRSAPVALDGQAFDTSSLIYVFVEGREGITRVRFYLDDEGMHRDPRTIRRLAPWDLAGGRNRAANPFALALLPEGTHTITAAVEWGRDTVEIVSASFSIGTISAAQARRPTTVEFPASPDHSAGERGVALLQRYELRCYQVGAVQHFHLADLGKPTPDGKGVIHIDLVQQRVPLPVGPSYAIRIAAIGPHGASLSEPSASVGGGISVPRLTPGPREWFSELR